MRFDRIEMTNYRSFGPGKPVIRFPAKENIVALVGAINAGKSNLLSALRLVLGSRRRDAGDPADFHQLDITQELRIDLHLRNPLKQENVYRRTDEIHGFCFRAHRGTRGAAKGRINTEDYCFDATATCTCHRPQPASGRDLYPARLSQFTTCRHLPIGSSPRTWAGCASSVRASIGHSTPAVTGSWRSSLICTAPTLAPTPTRTSSRPRPRKVITRAAAFDRLADRMTEVLRTNKLAEIEHSLGQNLRAVLGRTAAGAEVTIALPTAEELLAEILTLRVQDDAASPTLSVDRLGDGYRSLLRLAILRTYSELATDAEPSIFLIEEPEAYRAGQG